MQAIFKRGGILILLVATFGLAGPFEAAAGLLEVRAKGAEFLPEGIVEQVKGIPHVVQIERYLHVKAQPHDVIGIEPGAPPRIVTREGKLLTAEIDVGRGLKEGDKNVAIMGKVYREDYGFKAMGGMMQHPFEVGASFSFPGSNERVRVIGPFSVEPESESKRVFLPLSTAQRLFDKAGKLTHLFVGVDKAENAGQVADAIRKALAEVVEVISR